MFNNIITDYGGSPLGASGGTASAQSGFDVFAPGGGGLDITLFTWEFGPMTLLGAGIGDSVTQSPGAATQGFEDYRYDDSSGAAAKNLTFYYDSNEWVSGYVTQFVVEVDDNSDFDAVGGGSAYIDSFTVAGTDFYNELMSLTNNTGLLDFVATSFTPVVGTDPGTFSSAGQISTVSAVPEPSSWALIIGSAALAAVASRRWRATPKSDRAC